MGEADFKHTATTLYSDILYETLFGSCSIVDSLLHEGFLSLVKTALFPTSITTSGKKKILDTTFKIVTVKAMRAFFSADQSITSGQFLAGVRCSVDFPQDLKTYFQEAVGEYSPAEAYRLYRFVTDEKDLSPTFFTISLFSLIASGIHLYANTLYSSLSK